jgi:hypothetical protein
MRFGAGDTSIFHAIALHDFFKRNDAVFTSPTTFQRTLGELNVLEIFQVLQDGLTNVITLGPAGTPGELLKPLFD